MRAQRRGWRRVLLAEKDETIRAYQQGILNHEIYNHLLADIDARLLQVESGEKPELSTEKNGKEAGSLKASGQIWQTRSMVR